MKYRYEEGMEEYRNKVRKIKEELGPGTKLFALAIGVVYNAYGKDIDDYEQSIIRAAKDAVKRSIDNPEKYIFYGKYIEDLLDPTVKTLSKELYAFIPEEGVEYAGNGVIYCGRRDEFLSTFDFLEYILFHTDLLISNDYKYMYSDPDAVGNEIFCDCNCYYDMFVEDYLQDDPCTRKYDHIKCEYDKGVCETVRDYHILRRKKLMSE